MFKRQKVYENRGGEDGWTRLHVATLSGDGSLCARILQSESIPWSLVRAKTPKSMSTPLHFAVLGGSIECLRCLLCHLVPRAPPAEALAILVYQNTPIRFPLSMIAPVSDKSLAESFGPHEVVASPRRIGFSALDLAVICDNTEMTNELLEAMHWAYSHIASTAVPSPHGMRNHIGSDILQVAIAKGNAGAVTALLDRGASLELETDDDRGMRPIHWAVAFGNVDIICCLLQRGADPMSTTTVSQETVQDIAMMSLGNSMEILQIFDHTSHEV